jgi:hypothetical protein
VSFKGNWNAKDGEVEDRIRPQELGLSFVAIIKGYDDCLAIKNHMGVCEDKTLIIDDES